MQLETPFLLARQSLDQLPKGGMPALTQHSSSSVVRGKACVPSTLSFMAVLWNQVSYIFIA